MKKIGTILAASAICLTALSGCAADRKNMYTVYAPDGAPAIALSGVMHDGIDTTEFCIVQPTSIAQIVARGEADLAIMPINAAATLYNSGADLVVLTVNTHGNLYVVGDSDAAVESLSDLRGKKLGVIGQGQVPDLTLKILLSELGMTVGDDISVTYADSGAALLPQLKTGAIDYAFLAEPAATTAVTNLNKSIVLDVQQQWQSVFDSSYPQACLVARAQAMTDDADYRAYVTGFVQTLKESDGWAEQNPDLAVEAVASNMQQSTETSLNALSAAIIKRCNIKTQYASELKSECNVFFERLMQMTTPLGTSVLSKVPDDGFYYEFANA